MALHTELIAAREPGSRRLMIMLHGLGDSIEGYRWLPEALNLPWLNYLLVNAPDEYYGGYSWYDFAGNIAPGVARSRKPRYADAWPAQARLQPHSVRVSARRSSCWSRSLPTAACSRACRTMIAGDSFRLWHRSITPIASNAGGWPTRSPNSARPRA